MIQTGNNDALKNVLLKSYNIHSGAGCTIEYDMNSMINDPVITGTRTIVETSPFKKLFPIDSIANPNRPNAAGVKYYILGDIIPKEYVNQRFMTSPKDYRLYIPGEDLVYKYYLSALGDGSTSEGVSISYPKKAFVNKITVKFEISHSIPLSFNVYGTTYGGSETLLKSGTSSNIKAFESTKTFDEGTVSIYYTGSGWSFSESDLNTSQHVELSGVKLSFVAASDKYVGVIEVAPKYVIDVSDSIKDFTVNKESSADVEDVIPVGYINANTLTLNLNTYNKDRLLAKSFDKMNTSFESGLIYFYKMAIVKPYIKVYHSLGLYGSSDKYDKIPQGTFFMDSSDISAFGDFTINALDGAKILQEVIPQDALCENYAATAIIRRMLDNVGFTNYNFNLNGDTESSIISPNFWWTDDQKTVWEHLQEICRDSQITAVFDENNVLQFYSRDYLYGKTSADWTMHHEKNGEYLPNIIDFSKKDLPSGNKVKINWSTPQKTIADGTGTPIWQAPTSLLAAFSLQSDIPQSATAGDYISLSGIFTDDSSKDYYMNTFTGFFLINSEVIEFDAMQYHYKLAGSSTWETPVDITSSSDILKYNSLTDSNPANFQPTGKYRIKTRGALNTNGNVRHSASTSNILAAWTVGGTEFYTSGSINPSFSAKMVYTPDTVNKDNINQKGLFTITNKSKVSNHFEIAHKEFPALTTQTTSAIKYYTMGTTMFFDNPIDQPKATGGFAFFVSSGGNNMYFLQIRTTAATNALENQKDIKIYKLLNGRLISLADSQKTNTEITNIYGKIPYKIDISVESTSTRNIITAYVNGNKIVATDTQSSGNSLVPFSSRLGLMSIEGTSSFDYVYGLDLTEAEYKKNTVYSIYSGQYSDPVLKFVFGTRALDVSSVGTLNSAVEDFGPIAREIRKDLVRFDTRPTYPLIPSLGINEFASLLGYRLSPFGAEMYTMNNSGMFTPLSDGQSASYFVVGKTLSKSSQLEYKNYDVNKYTSQEPILFEPVWVQTEGDVKNLADWIKTQWSKRQMVVTLKVFGNPMISVGDLIEIDYNYQEIPTGQKFIVNNVTQTFDGGVETNIVCRTI